LIDPRRSRLTSFLPGSYRGGGDRRPTFGANQMCRGPAGRGDMEFHYTASASSRQRR
jgi:hypothetical protein